MITSLKLAISTVFRCACLACARASRVCIWGAYASRRAHALWSKPDLNSTLEQVILHSTLLTCLLQDRHSPCLVPHSSPCHPLWTPAHSSSGVSTCRAARRGRPSRPVWATPTPTAAPAPGTVRKGLLPGHRRWIQAETACLQTPRWTIDLGALSVGGSGASPSPLSG
jgi:hypothetical protein